MRGDLAQKQGKLLDGYLQALRNSSTASVNVKRRKRWKAPSCWQRTVKTCRRSSWPSLKSTVSCHRR